MVTDEIERRVIVKEARGDMQGFKVAMSVVTLEN
jgi:hypothetical protein